jgi:hypothetical protein
LTFAQTIAPAESGRGDFFYLNAIAPGKTKTAAPTFNGDGGFCFGALCAADVRRGRAFLAFRDLESDDIANLKIIKGYAIQLLGVEKEVLRFAIASDETESTIRKGLDSSLHVICLLL